MFKIVKSIVLHSKLYLKLNHLFLFLHFKCLAKIYSETLIMQCIKLFNYGLSITIVCFIFFSPNIECISNIKTKPRY